MVPDRPTLVFDGSCAMCRDCAELVRRWDRSGSVDVVPFQDQDRVARFGIGFERYAAAMHLLLPDGRVFAGADAAPVLLPLLPGKRWLAWPWALPGVPWLARRIYARIAARRRCAVPPAVDAAATGPLGSRSRP
jgi:predicted DCC family thiol-disulfide oxidoreductase YuxK